MQLFVWQDLILQVCIISPSCWYIPGFKKNVSLDEYTKYGLHFSTLVIALVNPKSYLLTWANVLIDLSPMLYNISKAVAFENILV